MQHLVDRRLIHRFDSISIVHSHDGVREPGSRKIDASVFDHEGVQVELNSRKLPFPRADFLVLLFEEGEDGWCVLSAVGDAGETNASVVGLVEGRVVEEDLSEVPHCIGGIDGAG